MEEKKRSIDIYDYGVFDLRFESFKHYHLKINNKYKIKET